MLIFSSFSWIAKLRFILIRSTIFPQILPQIMLLNAISLQQASYLSRNRFFINGLLCLSSDKKHVFRGVVNLNKLHHLSLVAAVFQNQGSHRIGNHNRLTLKEDAVFCNGIKLTRFLHLPPNLLMAAWRADYQFGIVSYTF